MWQYQRVLKNKGNFVQRSSQGEEDRRQRAGGMGFCATAAAPLRRFRRYAGCVDTAGDCAAYCQVPPGGGVRDSSTCGLRMTGGGGGRLPANDRTLLMTAPAFVNLSAAKNLT